MDGTHRRVRRGGACGVYGAKSGWSVLGWLEVTAEKFCPEYNWAEQNAVHSARPAQGTASSVIEAVHRT